MSIVADQRKKTTPQSRPNVASKKSSKQIQPPAQPATQNSKASGSTAALSTPTTTVPKPKSPPPPAAQAKPQQQIQAIEHVPLKGFNSSEIDALLSSGIDPEAEVYKAEHSQPQKSGPWGQKASTMATGKDFWLELRRQVAILQKGESTNKGG